jgi:centrosomal protein CEP104
VHTLERLRALELAKDRAVHEEDFEEAKRIKEAIDK